MSIYIIEHLEPKMWRWCLIEYKNISKIVGKENLWITNVRRGNKILINYAKVIKEPLKNLNLKNACILDPEADEILTPKKAKDFKYFIFGGILGDFPSQKRTKKELTSKLDYSSFSIGKKQMPTDNAVKTVKEICNGKSIEQLKFKDKIEIRTGKNQSVIFPFRYILINNKPLISKELISYLKRRRSI